MVFAVNLASSQIKAAAQRSTLFRLQSSCLGPNSNHRPFWGVSTYSAMASRSASPSDKTAHYSLQGLHDEWDQVPELRKRVRQGDHIFMHYDGETGRLTNRYVERTLNNVRFNREELAPLCRRVRAHGLVLPMIDAVIEEIRTLYSCAKVTVAYDTLYQEAWACRRLLSLGKNTLLHRKFISEDGVHECTCVSGLVNCPVELIKYK